MAALGAASALSLFGDMMLYTVLRSRHASLGISAEALGMLLSVHRFIRILANPLIGVLYDRVGRRRLFLLGMALAVLATGEPLDEPITS